MLATLTRRIAGPLCGRRRERLVILAGIAGLALVAVGALFLSGERRAYFLYYNVPIAAPFAAFLTERAVGRRRCAPMVVDASVLALSLARVFLPMSGYSGHALFCAYAALSSRTLALRLFAPLVLVEVAAIKVFLWGDATTLLGGLTVAAVAAWVRRGTRRPPRQHVEGDGPYRAAAAGTQRLSRSTPWPYLFALAAAAIIALTAHRDRFDPDRWRADEGYRTVRAARAGARRAREASREEACRLLGGSPCASSAGAAPALLRYPLSEPCGSLFSMTSCEFVLQLEDERVVAAWLEDTDGAPWDIECLHGCEREDMRQRMRPQR